MSVVVSLILGIHVSCAMYFLVHQARGWWWWWWTCGIKISFADVLIPNVFVTAHVLFKAGYENDKEEEEDWSDENERDGKKMGVMHRECL